MQNRRANDIPPENQRHLTAQKRHLYGTCNNSARQASQQCPGLFSGLGNLFAAKRFCNCRIRSLSLDFFFSHDRTRTAFRCTTIPVLTPSSLLHHKDSFFFDIFGSLMLAIFAFIGTFIFLNLVPPCLYFRKSI